MPDLIPEQLAIQHVVEGALIRVADNVAKHTVSRTGWDADDKCFQVDLRQSVAEIMDVVPRCFAEVDRLRAELAQREALCRELAALLDAYVSHTYRHSCGCEECHRYHVALARAREQGMLLKETT